MDAETIYAVLFVAALVWWMWRANHPAKKADTQPAPERPNVAPGTGKQGQDTDAFLTGLAAERRSAEVEAREAANAYKQTVEARVSEDEKLKARLAGFAKENQLDVALAQLWDEMRNYPAWAKRDDWHKWNKLGIENPSEDDYEDPRKRVMHFLYEGTKYTIATRQWEGIEDSSYMDFELLESGEEVFAISCEVVYDYATWYRPVGVTAFKRRGNWGAMLVRLFAKMNLESEKSSADMRARMASDIKRRFAE
ncbi:MAG: hypothetical protein A2Z90_15490 [Burkholderiales bacterium GWA2_64_37]|nr:MAG: hypothetical protein A2Z90_15490 [Burkholderiales bacterium GWA2_64_37]HCE92401.1 hypothetical protein [Acidovorax sp.]